MSELVGPVELAEQTGLSLEYVRVLMAPRDGVTRAEAESLIEATHAVTAPDPADWVRGGNTHGHLMDGAQIYADHDPSGSPAWCWDIYSAHGVYIGSGSGETLPALQELLV